MRAILCMTVGFSMGVLACSGGGGNTGGGNTGGSTTSTSATGGTGAGGTSPGGSDAGGSGGSGGTGGSAGSAEAIQAIVDGCGEPRPCGSLQPACIGGSEPECSEPFDPSTQCTLEHLAAGDSFALHLTLSGFEGENEWKDIVFLGNGEALVVASYQNPDDSQIYYGQPSRCLLESADIFQACLDAPSTNPTHADCMLPFSWWATCTPDPTATCPQ